MGNQIGAKVAELIRQGAMEMAVLTGRKYFETLALFLTQITNADVVLIGEITVEGKQARTIAVINDGEIADNFEFSLIESPFAHLLDGSMHIFARDLQSLFPDDYLIADLSLDAFAGLPIFSSQGNIIGFLVAMHRHSMENSDLTNHALNFFASRVSAELEQKLVFDELKEHESFLQGIINLTEDVLFITDLFGKIKMFSPSAGKILGWLPEELNNQSFYNFLSDDTRQLAIQEFEKCISSGLPKKRIQLMMKDKSGRIHLVEWFATPTRINHEINGCISIFRKLLTEP